MDNGIYIALSRQMALFRDMATTTNNLANANTTGYQAEKLVFNELLMQDINSGMRNKMAFPNDIATYRSAADGARRQTGNQLDVALEGEGHYFMVETPNGTRYTRGGNFSMNADGTLITPEGYPVLDNSGQTIEFPPEASDIVIGKAGNIAVNGEDFGTIGVAIFENPQMLKNVGGGLLDSEIEPDIGNEETISMSQGTLENSNVVPVIELTHMIELSRGQAAVAKYIETLYDLQRKTNNTWTQQS